MVHELGAQGLVIRVPAPHGLLTQLRLLTWSPTLLSRALEEFEKSQQ